MAMSNPRVNRGPAAAAGNRRAVLQAAAELFAERGYSVPMQAVARRADVGQGVLYRHFPTRLDLALAVFEDNLRELATLAEAPGADAFVQLWTRVLQMTVTDSAFVDTALASLQPDVEYDGVARLRSHLATTLPRARAAGLVDATVTEDLLLLSLRMVHGIVVTAVDRDPAAVTAEVRSALALLPGAAAVHDLGVAPPG